MCTGKYNDKNNFQFMYEGIQKVLRQILKKTSEYDQ